MLIETLQKMYITSSKSKQTRSTHAAIIYTITLRQNACGEDAKAARGEVFSPSEPFNEMRLRCGEAGTGVDESTTAVFDMFITSSLEGVRRVSSTSTIGSSSSVTYVKKGKYVL